MKSCYMKSKILYAVALAASAVSSAVAVPCAFVNELGAPGFVFAHRGGQKEHVENTMAAFAACYEAGIRGFETDVRMTKDGELVIHHDADTGRLFPVKARVEDLTLAEVKKLRTTEGNHPIPTLKEVLDYFADKPGCYIEFEMKTSDKSVYPQELLETYCRKLHDMVLKARPKGSQYIFTCFAGHVLETMRRIDPDCDMLAINPGPADAAQIARCKRLNIRRLGVLITQTTREMIDECHRNGIVVSVWPGNTLDDYFLARGLGADGICQNRPENVLRWRGEHEKPLAFDAGQTDAATGHVCGMLTAGNWNPPVKKRLGEVIEKNRGRKDAYAVFDFDYTMVIGDLSYTLIWHILEKEGRDTAAFWNEYRKIYRAEGDAAGVAWRSKVFEKYSSEELTALAKEAIAADLKRGRLEKVPGLRYEKRGLVFAPEMLELVRELRAAGITVYVVSGSRREALLSATGMDFGFKIPPECVFSANDGVITGEKPAFIRKHIMPRHGGAEPVLVVGDSIGDYGMLTEFRKTKARLLFRRSWREKEMDDLAASGDVLVQGRDETRGCYVPSSESVYP